MEKDEKFDNYVYKKNAIDIFDCMENSAFNLYVFLRNIVYFHYFHDPCMKALSNKWDRFWSGSREKNGIITFGEICEICGNYRTYEELENCCKGKKEAKHGKR